MGLSLKTCKIIGYGCVVIEIILSLIISIIYGVLWYREERSAKPATSPTEKCLLTLSSADQIKECNASITSLTELNRLIKHLATWEEFTKDLAATTGTLKVLVISSAKKDAFIESLIDINTKNSYPSDLSSGNKNLFIKTLNDTYDLMRGAASTFERSSTKKLTEEEERSKEILGTRYHSSMEKLHIARDACSAIIKALTEISELYAKVESITRTISSVVEDDVEAYYSTITLGNGNGIVVDQIIVHFSSFCHLHCNRYMRTHWMKILGYPNGDKKNFRVRIPTPIPHDIIRPSKIIKVRLYLSIKNPDKESIIIPMTPSFYDRETKSFTNSMITDTSCSCGLKFDGCSTQCF